MLLNQPTVHEVLHYLALLTFFSCWVSHYPQLGPYILAMLCSATVPLGRWCTLSRVSIPSSSAQVILSIFLFIVFSRFLLKGQVLSGIFPLSQPKAHLLTLSCKLRNLLESAVITSCCTVDICLHVCFPRRLGVWGCASSGPGSFQAH